MQKSSKSLKPVFSESLNALHNTTLDLIPYFTENHYRFIDSNAFIQDHTLVILETSSLPKLYTAISYVWYGLVAEPSQLEQDGSFHVFCGFHSDGTPREDGGPINIKVLSYACQWAAQRGSPYLWLDRLCIPQTSEIEKAWQIGHMFDIYESCEQCVVLPGGLQCLASVFDETTWAERAWTYQEAIVTWEYAVVLTKDWYYFVGEGHWLVDGECHWQDLQMLFIEGDGLLTRQADLGGNREDAKRPCLILGRNEKVLNTLATTMQLVALKHVSSEEEETISDQTIRQYVLQGVAMRTSSRPVDMVFSVLGLLGVQDIFQDHIHVSDFGEDERFRATLTLVEAMLCLEDNDEDGSPTTSSTLLDVPLWQSLEVVNSQHPGKSLDDKTSTRLGLDTMSLPTLRDLAQLFDTNTTEIQLSSRSDIILKRSPLTDWAFNVDQRVDDLNDKASAVALKIPESDLLNAYNGEGRVFVRHREEGIIELCRKLELKPLSEDEGVDLVVFGWSLKLDRHPYIRFYKFDISRLFLFSDM